jgi:hypothetical protein
MLSRLLSWPALTGEVSRIQMTAADMTVIREDSIARFLDTSRDIFNNIAKHLQNACRQSLRLPHKHCTLPAPLRGLTDSGDHPSFIRQVPERGGQNPLPGRTAERANRKAMHALWRLYFQLSDYPKISRSAIKMSGSDSNGY